VTLVVDRLSTDCAHPPALGGGCFFVAATSVVAAVSFSPWGKSLEPPWRQVTVWAGSAPPAFHVWCLVPSLVLADCLLHRRWYRPRTSR